MMKKLKFYFELFYVFFKIGAFTLGGGYAMIPLIQKEIVDNKKWVTEDRFIDILSLTQSAPGPIAINTAVFISYELSGIAGVFFGVLGSAMPSFFIILAIASIFNNFNENIYVIKAFNVIRPMVVSLIAYSVYKLGKNVVKDKRMWIVIIIISLIIAYLHISPIYFIILGVIYSIIRVVKKWGN